MRMILMQNFVKDSVKYATFCILFVSDKKKLTLVNCIRISEIKLINLKIMKSIILIITAVLFSFSASAQGGWGTGSYSNNASSATLSNGTANAVEWEEQSIDLGEIKQYHQAEVVFKMKNTGGKTVMILDAKKSCGCTDVEYPRKPILPGKTIKVKVTYDAEELGVFQKDITLTMSDGTPKQVIHFQGEVVK